MVILPALQGSVLEELIAKLLRSSGLGLLVEAARYKGTLMTASSGLVIRSREAKLQVDLLGQVRKQIPFSYPIRLFAEARFRRNPTDLDAVRNANGDASEDCSSENRPQEIPKSVASGACEERRRGWVA